MGIIAAYYDTASGEVIFKELIDGKNGASKMRYYNFLVKNEADY